MACTVALHTESAATMRAFIRLSFAVSVLVVLNVAKFVCRFGTEEALKCLGVSARLGIFPSFSDKAVLVGLRGSYCVYGARMLLRGR